MAAWMRIGCWALAAVAAAAVPARAGQGPSRPIHVYRGLFGPTESEERLRERLFLTVSIYGVADANAPFANGNDILDETLQGKRWYQGAQAQWSFLRQRPRSIITFNSSSALRYYSGLHNVTTMQHGGTLSGEFATAPHWKVRFGAGGSYAPQFQLQLGPAAADGAGGPQDFSVSRQKVLGYASNLSVTYARNRKSELVLGAGGDYSQFLGAPDYSTWSTGARFTRQLSRNVALRLGYAEGRRGRRGDLPTVVRDVDLGVNYSRGLSFSPRLTVSFGSGSSIVSTLDGQHVQLTGSALLKYQVSPRATAQVAAVRALQSFAAAPRPFTSDGLNGTLSAYLTRRTLIRWSPVYARGADVANALATFHSVSTQTRLEVALNRFTAVYVEHFYYRYRFSPEAELSLVAPSLGKQSARIGLALWSPVVR